MGQTEAEIRLVWKAVGQDKEMILAAVDAIVDSSVTITDGFEILDDALASVDSTEQSKQGMGFPGFWTIYRLLPQV